MKKWVLVLGVLIPTMSFAEWTACGVDARGDVANCEYQIVDGTLTIRATSENGTTGSWYSSAQNQLIQPWKDKGVTKVVIEEGITEIGYYSFEEMRGITSVTLPEGLKTIKQEAFYAATNLSEINLPSTLETIDKWGLCSTKLSSIIVPESVKNIDTLGLYSPYLTTAVIPEDATFTKNIFHTAPLENVYCGQKNIEQCRQAVSYRGDDVTIDHYILEDGVYILADDDWKPTGSYYTSAKNMTDNSACQADLDVCKAMVLQNKGLCSDLTGDCKAFVDTAKAGQMLKIGSKTYQSLNDLLKGNYDKRRIYTIEEANFVAGKVNRVSIKYR